MSDQRRDKGIPSEADQLRRASERFGRNTATGILLANAAFIAENGCEWLDYVNRPVEDVEVKR